MEENNHLLRTLNWKERRDRRKQTRRTTGVHTKEIAKWYLKPHMLIATLNVSGLYMQAERPRLFVTLRS